VETISSVTATAPGSFFSLLSLFAAVVTTITDVAVLAANLS